MAVSGGPFILFIFCLFHDRKYAHSHYMERIIEEKNYDSIIDFPVKKICEE